MHGQNRGLRLPLALLATVSVALALGACGGDSSGQATTLLKQTFSGSHKVQSGILGVTLTLNPSGSSTVNAPITLSFGGPFQSLGTGKLPESDFTISVSALGRTGSLGLLSTGARGFVRLQGVSYQLPQATFHKLESSFAGLTSGSGGAGGGLGNLGIDPLKWLVHPTIAGNDTVGGVATTHVKTGVNVAALLSDISKLLSKAGSLGLPGAANIPTSISPATQSRIASEVRNPGVDVWTGASDKTARKIAINLTVPVSGQLSTLLGGLSSAGIGLTIQYSALNQPQTVAVPTNVRPFSEFTAKLKAFTQSLGGVLGGAGAGSTGTGTVPTTTGPSPAPGTPPNLNAFSKCLAAANGDITKGQKCASLLSK